MPLVGNETTRIQLTTPGEWVDVKSRLSRGDVTEIEKALVRSRSINGLEFEGGDPSDMLEAAEYTILEIAIQAWSFDVPLSPENIRRLDPADYDIIRAKLNELTPSRTDDERGNSFASGPTPHSTAEASLANSNGTR